MPRRSKPDAPAGLAALVAALVAALAAGPSDGASARSVPCGLAGSSPPAREAALARELLDAVNDHRKTRGLRPVRAAASLQRAAAWKARHAARLGHLSHADPAGGTLVRRLRACGFTGSGWGEVLAAGQLRPRAVLAAWLASPGHRAVIEAPWSRLGGAGVARSRSGARYWALDLGA